MQTRNIFATAFAGLCRFLGGAIFGGFISLLIFFVVFWLGLYGFWNCYWKHSLWLIPLGWGILAIFWFDRMLDMARDIVEWFIGE